MSLLAPLHDIGKVGIRDAVLNKTSALTAAEMHEMQQHPVYGYETISKAQRQVGIDSAHDEEILQLAKDIVYTHHERWDGTGYPRGLRGEEIPLAGRIMALVDVYERWSNLGRTDGVCHTTKRWPSSWPGAAHSSTQTLSRHS